MILIALKMALDMQKIYPLVGAPVKPAESSEWKFHTLNDRKQNGEQF
jgi:hypothetical protein